jgi:hypothetical protein
MMVPYPVPEACILVFSLIFWRFLPVNYFKDHSFQQYFMNEEKFDATL